MRNRLLINLLSVLIFSCSDPVGEVFFETQSGFIQGEVQYVQLASGDTIRSESNIMSSISYQDGRFIAQQTTDTIMGTQFQFGPLALGENFIIRSQFYDSENKILYEGSVLADSLGDGINKVNVLLIPSTSTLSISGNISYTDIVTSIEVTNQTSITTRLRNIDNNQEISSTGRAFRFDSLKSGTNYLISSSYHDTLNHIAYSFDTTLTVATDQILTNIPVSLSANVDQVTLKGTLFYTDVITGQQEVAEEAVGIIKSTDPLQGFSEEVSHTSNGGNYSFGPLRAGSYIRAFNFQTSTYDYHYTDTIVVDTEDVLISGNLYLEREKQTVFSGEIYYTDPTNGIRQIATNAVGEIKFVNPLQTFSHDISSTSNSSSYTFGPLTPDTYIRSFTFSDGLFSYIYTDTISIDGIEPFTFEEIDLNIENETLRAGVVNYIHPISGNREIATTAEVRLRFNDPLKAFETGNELISNGSSFSFGPLRPDSYVRDITFNDGIFDYSLTDTLEINGMEPIVYEEVDLTWETSTGLIVRVTDDLGNLLDGANVYLYRNYNFLLTYRDNPDVAIAHGVTSADGSVTFAGLETGGMYVYATRVFASDTLTNISSSSTPISLVTDIVRTLNTHVE